MAFPTSPSNGDIYRNYKYNSTTISWDKTYLDHSNSGNNSDYYLEFLNGVKFQFGRRQGLGSPLTTTYPESFIVAPAVITQQNRSSFYASNGTSNINPTTTSFVFYIRKYDNTNLVETSSVDGHWIAWEN